MADPVLSGRDVYDALMAKIEPDLVENMLPELAEKYRGESADEHEARMARYEKAFAEYDTQFTAFLSGLHGEVKQVQRTARQVAEQQSTAEDEKIEVNILSHITND